MKEWNKLKGLKYFLIGCVFVIGSTNTFASTNNAVEVLTQKTIELIKNSDRDGFNQLFSRKELHANSEEFKRYYLQTQPLLSSKHLKFVTFHENDCAVVVFYRSDRVLKPKKLDWTRFKTHWMESIVALELIQTQKGWRYKDTPFYFFRHAPWASYYG